MNILLIDDDFSLSDSLQRLLVLLGHQVTYASHGAAAEKEAAASEYDLVVCDWDFGMMDSRNGGEICESLRPLLPDAKFVICSGLDRPVPPWIEFIPKGGFERLEAVLDELSPKERAEA